MSIARIQAENNSWLSNACHLLTDLMVGMADQELSKDDQMVLASLISEVVSRYPENWPTLHCENILFSLNLSEAVAIEDVRTFRSRLMALLRLKGSMCMTEGRWESPAMKIQQTRPVSKKLAKLAADHNLAVNLYEFQGFSILRVSYPNHKAFRGALEKADISSSYQMF